MTLEATAPPRWAAKAGQRGGIVWQFDKSGTVDFACLVPGHTEAGMTGRFVVNP
jgi:uncharacterized cupredoxin-like copper-binding protein